MSETATPPTVAMTAARPRPVLGLDSIKVDYAVGRGRSRATLHAVDGVTLEVFPGEALGLVGESGCGKSTLAKVAVGLQPPTGGAVLVRDKEVPAKRSRALITDVQLVFQDPTMSLNPRMTVGATLRELLLYHHIVDRRHVDARIAELLAMVELPRRAAEAYPRRLSGGQRQRVAIARALAVEPKVLVADEPVAALDVSVQAAILALLERLRAELELAVLFISHDLAVVSRLCDRVAVMYLGRIVEQAPTAELFRNPQHPYTRLLIDSIPRLHRRREGLLPELVGEPPSPANLPVGCRFRPRCPSAFGPCATTDPVLPFLSVTARHEHVVACHLTSDSASEF